MAKEDCAALPILIATRPRHEGEHMARGLSLRFQLRLISCHLAGIAAQSAAMPYLLRAGLEIGNLVPAWALGVVLFLAIAILGGLIWRRQIRAQPVSSALAAPAAIAVAIYLLLRTLSGFDSAEAGMALDASLIGGLCALFSSGFFMLWTYVAPADPSGERSGGE